MIAINIGGVPAKVDPDRLTPVARALAHAIADTPGRTTVDIWMEADQPIRDTTPGWEHWYTVEEAAQPERRPWRGWSDVPLGPAEDPYARLEHEANKIPVGWHVYGAHPHRPLPDAGPIREATSKQVLDHLRRRGRRITPATWRSYVARSQAPAPSRTVGRTPLWNMDDINTWIAPTMRTYTVEAQTGTATGDGIAWTAANPTGTVADDHPTFDTAQTVGDHIANTRNGTDNPLFRVLVWGGPDADRSTEPDAVGYRAEGWTS